MAMLPLSGSQSVEKRHGGAVLWLLQMLGLMQHLGGPPGCDRLVGVTQAASPSDAFNAAERELIRRAFGLHFGSYPAIAEGIFLRSGRGGPRAGQPKLPQPFKA
jgi:hypothetical protein